MKIRQPNYYLKSRVACAKASNKYDGTGYENRENGNEIMDMDPTFEPGS